jgi:hypothetical protein
MAKAFGAANTRADDSGMLRSGPSMFRYISA